MSFFNEKPYMYTIKSAWTDKYLYLEDDTLVAIENAEVITDSNAYFYVLNVPDADWKGRFQFKPLNEPDLYIAVVNGEFALKAANECKESERSFYYNDKNQYYKSFDVKENGTSYFLCCKYDGELYVSTQEVGDESLFELTPKEDETTFAEVEDQLFAELITEIVLNEE